MYSAILPPIGGIVPKTSSPGLNLESYGASTIVPLKSNPTPLPSTAHFANHSINSGNLSPHKNFASTGLIPATLTFTITVFGVN
jgi:hypothetical protein